MTPMEQLGKELARQIHMLQGLKEERQIAMENFKMREKTIEREINRLAIDVRSGQVGLYQETTED